MPHDQQRPDPDALLAQLREDERRAARGRLRIYFGASAGVGKTYAMLQEARKLQAEGRAPLVGVIETHGRAETARLLDGLELLARRRIDYRGRQLDEFDLDAALARAPSIILVDELAHSNAPGSRHPKRWQDVEELLAAGIDVLTTVNVQHLESLNEVVGGIAGIRVAETVPDRVFDAADEVIMVDLPADALLARLKEGKVYQPQQAERAAGNFFKKGNLIALRELALRRTADRVEGDVRAWREQQSVEAIWKTGAGLLVCVGPGALAEHVVRSSARMASQLGAGWHAVYVETPRLARLPDAARQRILDSLALAQDLGATTAVLSGEDVAAMTLEYARDHNLSRIALGRVGSRWPWRRRTARRLARQAPGIDLIEIGQPAVAPMPTATTTTAADGAARPRPPLLPHLLAAGASILTAILATPLRPWLDPVNIVMLFLLVVLLTAIRFGRAPSVTATCVGVAAFDFFFVPPRFDFAVTDVQYLVTFGVMLAVGLISGHLAAGLRFQARAASQRERRVRALYEFARELSGVLAASQVFEASRAVIQNAFGARATLLVPDAEGRLGMPPADDGGPAAPLPATVDPGVAQWAFDRAQAAGLGTDTLPASPLFYLPLVAPMRTRGVLAIEPHGERWVLVPEQRRQLDALAALAAIALERVHYVEVAQAALVDMASERLRNSLLAALSHDLRTPLTALVGLSESLLRSDALQQEQAPRALAQSLHDEALRMGTLVANLLDMARIESGEVRFNLEWQALEEVVGSALRACGAALREHAVAVRLAPDLPLVRFDAVLIERVLCNLVENAAKYTPDGARIEIVAARRGAWIDVSVVDDGPGLRPGSEETIFEKFTRGERESALPGVGLGLAICRAIVEAHGGTIRACASPLGGAGFVFSLPAGTPPALDMLLMEQDDD